MLKMQARWEKMKKELILTQTAKVKLCYSKQENKAVVRSVEQLKRDIEKVVGCACVINCSEVTKDKTKSKDIWEILKDTLQ